jgi:hypothetical protein
MITGARFVPMTRNPLVVAPDPIPITRNPHIPGSGRHTDHFIARRRRCHQDDPADVVTLIGNHDAAKQRRTQYQRAEQSAANPFLTHDPTHFRAHHLDTPQQAVIYGVATRPA